MPLQSQILTFRHLTSNFDLKFFLGNSIGCLDMLIHFLGTNTPLTKTYWKGPNGIEKTSYPAAYEFTSYDENCTDLNDLLKAMLTRSTRPLPAWAIDSP